MLAGAIEAPMRIRLWPTSRRPPVIGIEAAEQRLRRALTVRGAQTDACSLSALRGHLEDSGVLAPNLKTPATPASA
jgi:hypothetical protein